MTESITFRCATDRAGLCYGTSCIIPGMTKCRCESFAADRTGLRSGTSRRRAGGVSLSSNYSLCYNNCVTYRTVLTFGKTGGGTGRSYCRVNYFSVSELCNSFGLGTTASCASVGLYTFFSTSRRFGNNTAIVAVAESGNFCLCCRDSSANRTVLTLGKTGCGTGRSYCRINYFSVSKLCNSFGLGATTL